jgi:hypothetical protein
MAPLLDKLSWKVETVKDFFSELGMKPHVRLVDINIFFAKPCHRQAYQNYEQSRHKLGTFLENEVL